MPNSIDDVPAFDVSSRGIPRVILFGGANLCLWPPCTSLWLTISLSFCHLVWVYSSMVCLWLIFPYIYVLADICCTVSRANVPFTNVYPWSSVWLMFNHRRDKISVVDLDGWLRYSCVIWKLCSIVSFIVSSVRSSLVECDCIVHRVLTGLIWWARPTFTAHVHFFH